CSYFSTAAPFELSMLHPQGALGSKLPVPPQVLIIIKLFRGSRVSRDSCSANTFKKYYTIIITKVKREQL
ncbi:MAG: hypothetical protein IKY45_00410, partial [Clostridia bacterium]|nr:hypothetical protein [Clostridia bacterium]